MLSMSDAKRFAQELLDLAGVKINGTRLYDIRVHDEKLCDRIFSEGTLGFGEAYMNGWWDVPRLDEFFSKILHAQLDKKVSQNPRFIFWYLRRIIFNPQTIRRSFTVGEQHYDIGNDLYQAMLDKRLTYTCGYWKNARNLDQAQEAKLDLVCKKIGLRKGQKVLDIGCGWGSFLKFAAEKYGVHGVGVTVSKEQIVLGRKLCKGLPVKLLLQDYRQVTGMFDHIVSLGMFEHVGYKNYRTYMKVVSDHLKPDGLFLLHTIGQDVSQKTGEPWIEKYIFPNSMIPSVAQVAKAIEGIFVMEDWHNFGAYYDRTIGEWHKNFNKNWKDLKKKYDKRFYRMWNYYLCAVRGSFRARKNSLWQIVLSKGGLPEGYTSIR